MPRKVELTRELVDLHAKLAREGVSIPEACRIAGHSVGTYYRWVDEAKAADERRQAEEEAAFERALAEDWEYISAVDERLGAAEAQLRREFTENEIISIVQRVKEIGGDELDALDDVLTEVVSDD